MIEFEDAVRCEAAAVEVWKLVHDPARFPEWWSGLDRVETGEDGQVRRYVAQWPDFAYPTRVSSSYGAGRVVISCLISDIEHVWTLEPGAEGGCTARVTVRVPDDEAARVEDLREEMALSLPRLAAVAAGT